MDVIVQRQDNTGLAVLQNIRHGHLHDYVGQFCLHHHKVQAFGKVFLRGIVKFKIDIEHLAHHLKDLHLIHRDLVTGFAAEDAHGDALALRCAARIRSGASGGGSGCGGCA